MKDIEDVRLLLKEAFADVRIDKSRDQTEPSHEDCIQLRDDLCVLEEIDLKWYLPRVLEDLLDNRTNDPMESKYACFVLTHLNVDNYTSEKYFRYYAELFGEDAVHRMKEDNAQQSVYSKKRFSIFDKKQAYAIYEWFELALTWWSDSEDCEDDLKGAIDYWKQLAFE